jgi:hypothetical protein
MKQTVYFSVHVDLDCNQTKGKADGFKTKVRSALNDARGWAQFGFVFVESETASSRVQIRLTCPKRMNTYGKGGLEDLNLCDIVNKIIYVHSDRWMNFHAHKNKSAMDLDTYRTYIINHEMGHALGFDTHLEACLADGTSPVMRQQTPGQWTATGKCTPNPYPTPLDFSALQERIKSA